MKKQLREIRKNFQLAKLRLKQFYNLGNLPEFYIIGAAKSGTSSLYTALTQHPGIIDRIDKEIHFFDHPQKRNKGIAYYKAHFLPEFQKKQISKRLGYTPLEGDATPFMFHFWIPKWLFDVNPHAKLIAILRNPVDRALSAYYHNKRRGREPLSFEDVIALETDRVKQESENLKIDPQASIYNYSTFSYLGRGRYYEQLTRWLEFFPQEQLCVISFEEFVSNQTETCSKLFNFLGLPEYQVKRNNKLNSGSYQKSMNGELRQKLKTYFEKHNQKLFDLINKQFNWD